MKSHESASSYRRMTPHRFSLETRMAQITFGEEGSNLRFLVHSQTAYR